MVSLVTCANCRTAADRRIVGDNVGLFSLLLHLNKELQGPLCHLTLSACPDLSAVSDHLGL